MATRIDVIVLLLSAWRTRWWGARPDPRRAPEWIRSGGECRRQVLVDVLLGDDRRVQHDAARDVDLDEVGHRLALHQQSGETDAVGGLRRRVDDRRLQHGVV